MKISNELIAKVRSLVFNELGITMPAVFEVSTNWVEVAVKHPIPTSHLGPFAPAIESMTVTVSVGFSEENEERSERANVRYEYDYNHPCGGHNGYTHRVSFGL